MKWIKKIYDVFCGIEGFILVCIILLNIGPYFINMKPYVLTNGSMEPTLHTGSMVYVTTDVEASDIEAGDIIAFQLGDKTNVTHRVVEVNQESECFITKGDANQAVDFEPVPFESLIGITKFSIPYFGYFMGWLNTLQGKIIIVGLFVSQLILNYLLNDTEENNHEQEI